MENSRCKEKAGLPGPGDFPGASGPARGAVVPDGFLSGQALADACGRLAFPGPFTGRVLKAAGRVRSDAALCGLAGHCHHAIFRAGLARSEDILRWPPLEAFRARLGNEAGFFYLLVFLSGVPGLLDRLAETGRRRGIPAPVLRDTIADMAGDLDEYWKIHGGLPPGSLRFRVYTHLGGEYYRLGRLCFHLNTFRDRVHVFRHARGGRVLALSGGGARCLENGRLDGPGRRSRAGAWTATLETGPERLRGFPILPGGRVAGEAIDLPAGDWRPVLAPGDTVLDIHIPAGSPMDFAACGRSMRAAGPFFARHFPERPWAAFTCRSWLLDSTLQELLPADSNILRFQGEFHLYPALSDDRHLVRTVFGRRSKNIGRVSGKTTLERRILKRLREGDRLEAQAGGCFLPAGDERDWGAARKGENRWWITSA